MVYKPISFVSKLRIYVFVVAPTHHSLFRLQVHVQPVHQNGQKLVRVLLVHAAKDLLALANDAPQIVAGYVPMLVHPDLADDGAKLFGDRSLVARATMELLSVTVVLYKKVLEAWRVAQALHDAVHVARVAKVLQTRQAMALLGIIVYEIKL